MTSNEALLVCADGGLIGRNPSAVGGTWAYVIARTNGTTVEGSGVILPGKLGVDRVTNNHSEMYALLSGMLALPIDFRGLVMSDSMVTLGRIFLGWKWSNTPPLLHSMYREVLLHLIYWDSIRHMLLDGHPTQSQLNAGTGKRGNPVSVYNVLCDQLCGKRAKDYLKGVIDAQ